MHKRRGYCEIYKSSEDKMAGTRKENGSGSKTEKDNGGLFIGRRKGRPRLRCMDNDVADLKVMKINQWLEETNDREQRRLVVETKAHPGL
jgi:hypothetical protein